jgi:hypothetical protein
MRTLLSCVITAGLLAGHAAAAQSCAQPTEKAAFDIAGLKSQLMVVALKCQAYDRYDAFVTRFRPDLLNAERGLNSYFGRTYGRRAQAEHDDYITSLANDQSQSSGQLGDRFCTASLGLFDEVMSLRSGAELPLLAASKSIAQPLALVECATGASAAVQPRHR